MVEDDDWDIEEDEDEYETDGDETGVSKRIVIVLVVAVLVIASVGSYVALRDEDDSGLPSKVNVPTLKVGMDWWYQQEQTLIFHDTGTNETAFWGHWQIMVRDNSNVAGKSAYLMSSIFAYNSTTRHDRADERQMSAESMNFMNSSGDDQVIFDFPLYDRKEWNWTDSLDYNRSYICNAYRGIETPANTYNTYRIRMTWTENEGDDRREFTYDFFYSPSLRYFAKIVMATDAYQDNALTWTNIITSELVLHDTSDSDNDGLSNKGEKWFGTDPGKSDTDGDGMDDLQDQIPLFDLGLSVNLTHISTDENVESVDEVLIFGEEDGADFYFIFDNDVNDDELFTDPIDNSDDTDLDVQYRFDVPDDEYSLWVDIRCFDADSDGDDDEIDITEDFNDDILRLVYYPHRRFLEKNMPPPGTYELELDVEHEVAGDGNGDYDATLRFIVSEIEIRDYH